MLETTGTERRIALLAPKAGWDRTSFEQYWLHQHGRLVATTPEYGRYRADYVQDHVNRADLGSEPFPFAGVASVRLPTDKTPNFASSTTFLERILPDEEHFLDRRTSIGLHVREHRVRLGNAAVKCLAFGMFDSDLASLSSLTAQLNALQSIAPQPRDTLIGEVQNPLTDLSGAALAFDPGVSWVEESRFDSVEEANAHYSARRLHRAATPRWAIVSDEHILFALGKPIIDRSHRVRSNE